MRSISVSAQIDTDTLEVDEVFIYKEYTPEVSSSEKIQTTPEIIRSSVAKEQVNYSYVPKKIKNAFDYQPITPVKMKADPLPRLYPGFLKVGVGSKLSTLAELAYTSKRSRKMVYGIDIRHQGAFEAIKGYSGSKFMQNQGGFYGKYFLKKWRLSGDVGYGYNEWAYYGLLKNRNEAVPTGNTESQIDRNPNINLEANSFFRDSSRVNWSLKAAYEGHYYNGPNTENTVQVSAVAKRYLGKELLQLALSMNNNRFAFEDKTQDGLLLGFNPHIVSGGKNWRLNIGFNAMMDRNQNVSRFYFKPKGELKYNIADVIISFIGIDGGVDRQNISSLLSVNPYLNLNQQLINQHNRLHLYGGIRGGWSKTVQFYGLVHYKKMDNYAIFLPDSSLPNNRKFVVQYDSLTIYTYKLGTQIALKENFKLNLSGTYYTYQRDVAKTNWHLPNYRADLNLEYNIANKIIGRANVYYLSTRIAGQYNPVGELLQEELKPYLDLNLFAEYRYTTRLSAFIEFRNLFASGYMRWADYPVQGFVALGGLTVSF